jgi:hypothetical protein
LGRAVKGDFIFSIDLDPNTNGVQNTFTVNPGQIFIANIWMEYNKPIGLDSFRFSVDLESTGMIANTATTIPPAGFKIGLAGQPRIDGSMVSGFNAESLSIGEGPMTIAPVIIGTIQLTAGFSTGIYLITPFEDGVFDGSYGNDFEPIDTITFNSAFVTITAVPEPSSLTLAVIAAGMFGLKFRRRKLT